MADGRAVCYFAQDWRNNTRKTTATKQNGSVQAQELLKRFRKNKKEILR